MRILDSVRSWRAEEQCHELLDVLRVEGDTLDEGAFLGRVGQVAGGQVNLTRLDDGIWAPLQAAMLGHVSGVAMPYPGGWVILLPRTPVAHESTVIGHEAAHIIFGDVPPWDRCSPEYRASVTRWRDGDPLDPSQMLPRSALRVRTDSRREARAERFGALLTARLETRDDRPQATDRVDQFFQVGEV